MPLRLRSALIGCGIGCGALLVVLLVGSVAFFVWLNRPATLLQPEKLLAADTTGYLEWTMRLEDPGTRELVQAALDLGRAQRDNPDNPIPLPVRRVLFAMQQRRNERKIKELFPMVLTWSMRPDERPRSDLHLGALSMESMDNKLVMVDWFLGFLFKRTDDVEVVSHGRERIYVVDEGPVTFFLRRNGVFFTSDLETAQRAVDRLDRPVPRAEAEIPVERLLAEAGPQHQLRGGVSNSGGEIFRLWELLSDEPLSAGLRQSLREEVNALAVSGGFTGDAAFSVTLTFVGPDSSWARDHTDELTGGVRELLERIDLPLGCSGSTDGPGVRVELRVDDLPDLIRNLPERLASIGDD